MTWLSAAADRWPVIGPAIANAVVQVALIWQLDLTAEAQAATVAVGSVLAALVAMLRAYKPTTVAKATDSAFELGRAAGVREILEVAGREPARDPIPWAPTRVPPPDGLDA